MSREKIKMNKVRQILKLFYEKRYKKKAIAKEAGVPRSTVRDYLERAQTANLTAEELQVLSEEQLNNKLFQQSPLKKPEPDWQYIHKELKLKGVTLQLLWEEYCEQHPLGYRYSGFCEVYNKWKTPLDAWMKQDHKAGEKLFIDYSGLTLPYKNPETGELYKAEIFVAAMGASNFIYCEATPTQSLHHWIASHVRTFAYLGGVPVVIIPDNLKSGVTKAHRYDPQANRSYEEMAQHYGVSIMPARSYSPKDKAKVENAVLQVERRILAKLRGRIFFSVEEMNQAIKPLLEELNERAFQKLEGSRKELFLSIDKPALNPLPQHAYEFATWLTTRLDHGYHIKVNARDYSAPYLYIGKKVDVRIAEKTLEFFCQNQRIACHIRHDKPGRTTLDEHRPEAHREHAKWNQETLLEWANRIGTETTQLAQTIFDESHSFIEQKERRVLGILRLSNSYGDFSLEAACHVANKHHIKRYERILDLIKNQFVQSTNQVAATKNSPQQHEYIRGADYYN